LRVHAAHPLGLGIPIVGDDLYGCKDERLFLHAESLEFTHPVTKEKVKLEKKLKKNIG
jgi:tRNA pseudouridine32 synthase/23S rRNA pseudouridine746 synthase